MKQKSITIIKHEEAGRLVGREKASHQEELYQRCWGGVCILGLHVGGESPERRGI